MAPRPSTARAARRRLPVWAAATAVVLAAYVAHLATGLGGSGLDGFFNNWVQCGLLLNGAVLSLVGARRQAHRLPWLLCGAGLAAWALGNVAWSAWLSRLDAPPYPSVADALWLVYYPATYAALVLLVKRRVERWRPSTCLDGLIGACGAAAVAAAVLWPSIQQAAASAPAETLTNLAYPVADVLLLAVVAASVTLAGVRLDRGLALIVLGLLLNTAADGAYLLLIAGGWEDQPSLLDPLWVAAQLCLAAAAFQPVPERSERLEGWRLMALPVAFATAAVGLLTWGAVQTLATIPSALAVVTVAAAAARAAMTYRENSRLADAHRQARTDDLTGLGNRRALYARLEAVLDADRRVALLLFDLDGFKDLNDALGHHAGDELLVELADRLRRTLDGADLLARLGGDEFVALLADAGVDEGILAGHAVREALRTSFRLDGTDVHVQASAGLAVAPLHGRTRSELLKHADAAMYRAKRDRSGLEVHDPRVRAPDAERLQLASDLHGAIARDELVVLFQPKVDLATDHVTGAEALVRWQHPDRGLLAPDVFLPLAERHGLMPELTAAVLDAALAQQAAWRAAGLPIPVAVNLARANLVDAGLPASIAAALERHGATPDDLRLEITEDTVMTDADRVLDVLDALRALGVQLALDDFGTGHSSLAHLKRLPVDELKIDRSFVLAMTTDHRDEAIVDAATTLGLRFGMRVVAEGVEDAATCDRLRGLGVHEIQGYYVARPLSGADVLLVAAERASGQPGSSPGSSRTA